MFVLEGIEVGFNQEQDKWTIRGNQMQDFRTAGTEVVDVPTEDRLGIKYLQARWPDTLSLMSGAAGWVSPLGIKDASVSNNLIS